jgi:hypothetical protein
MTLPVLRLTPSDRIRNLHSLIKIIPQYLHDVTQKHHKEPQSG